MTESEAEINLARGNIELPGAVSRDEWLAARKKLLAKQKELTYARDALNAMCCRLPMIEPGKDYDFQGPDGGYGTTYVADRRRTELRSR